MEGESSTYSVFLLGDSGKPKLDGTDEVLNLLKVKLSEKQENSIAIFLGDNIYPNGLPDLNDPKRSLAEKRIKIQLDTLSGYKGKVFFISGNHDWNKGKKGGLEYVRRQEKFIEDYLDRGNVYLPDMGCPGPVEVDISPFFRIIFINTQWWVQKGKKPIGPKEGCLARSESDFYHLFDDLLYKSNKTTLIVAHHPLYSKAIHGGAFSYKQHIFPLRFLNKNLFVPLPVAGSLYPLYRKYFGAVEDISYPPYRRMKKKLLQVMNHHENLIYVAGHDHNLQYIKKHGLHYLISGSGSSAAYVRKGRSSVFSYSVKGFLELQVNNTRSNILAWGADASEPAGIKLYEGQMF